MKVGLLFGGPQHCGFPALTPGGSSCATCTWREEDAAPPPLEKLLPLLLVGCLVSVLLCISRAWLSVSVFGVAWLNHLGFLPLVVVLLKNRQKNTVVDQKGIRG